MGLFNRIKEALGKTRDKVVGSFKSILPIGILSLERFAPGKDHPLFQWLAPRWRTALTGR